MAEETEMSESVAQAPAVSKQKPPADGPETEAMTKRAKKGDKSCLPMIRALLADGDRGESFREAYGFPASWFQQTAINKASGRDLMIEEAINQQIEAVESKLAGPNPTPIERLLAERASLCWFIVHWYETQYTNSSGWTIAQADLQHRKIDKAHARFISAFRTLAQVRKLAAPTLQVNIGQNQVNVAETRP
jgi:hypothetical protein